MGDGAQRGARRRPQRDTHRRSPPQPQRRTAAEGLAPWRKSPRGGKVKRGACHGQGRETTGGSGLEGNGARGKSCLRGALGTLIGKRGGILTVL